VRQTGGMICGYASGWSCATQALRPYFEEGVALGGATGDALRPAGFGTFSSRTGSSYSRVFRTR
jgi:hypothetical protein